MSPIEFGGEMIDFLFEQSETLLLPEFLNRFHAVIEFSPKNKILKAEGIDHGSFQHHWTLVRAIRNKLASACKLNFLAGRRLRKLKELRAGALHCLLMECCGSVMAGQIAGLVSKVLVFQKISIVAAKVIQREAARWADVGDHKNV